MFLKFVLNLITYLVFLSNMLHINMFIKNINSEQLSALGKKAIKEFVKTPVDRVTPFE